MKFMMLVAVMAFVVAGVLACDPDSNNEPVCTKDNLNKKIRNFWDPTCYWLCKAAGGKAQSVRCTSGQGFYSPNERCVPWDQWSWTPACPSNNV